MAYLPPERAAEGPELAIDVRGKERPAVVASKPRSVHQRDGAAK
jgi:glycine cleavage system aminomethyltransferase T